MGPSPTRRDGPFSFPGSTPFPQGETLRVLVGADTLAQGETL